MMVRPHFSPAFYCGDGSGHVYCVALHRAPRRTVEYACGALGRAPCIHARLRRLATKPDEKCGLAAKKAAPKMSLGTLVFSVTPSRGRGWQRI